MATLQLKDCREFAVFKAFMECDDFASVIKSLEDFEKTHSTEKIFNSAVDKKTLKEVFAICLDARRTAFPRGEIPDFNDVSCINRFKNVFHQKLPNILKGKNDSYTSALKGKINLGALFMDKARRISDMGLRYYHQQVRQEREPEIEHEQVMTGKYKKLGVGYGGGSVFSPKNTFKTTQEMLLEKMAQERYKRGYFDFKQ